MLFAALLSMISLGLAESQRKSAADRLDSAGQVLHEIMATTDNGIPEEIIERARCVAVVPHMLKEGFVFGAENGRGVVTCRTSEGWSAPAFFAISGGSWGLQTGVEGVNLIMIIQNDRTMHRLLSNRFEIGADASSAAGPVGRRTSANTGWKLDSDILTYSSAKGVFAGLALNGASIRSDVHSMEAVYGRQFSTRRVLQGELAAPEAARSFLIAVRDVKTQAAESGR
jgi:lipid-binding SYLF domain-containing protein